jgi:hypothetical protein
VPGYIAGVTNPMFQERDTWWDLVCILDLSNGTGIVRTAEEKRIEDAKNNPNSKSHSNSHSNMSNNSSYAALDARFITEVCSMVNLGEMYVRKKFFDYTMAILNQALSIKEGAFKVRSPRSALDSLVEANKKISPRGKKSNAHNSNNHSGISIERSNLPRATKLLESDQLNELPSNPWVWSEASRHVFKRSGPSVAPTPSNASKPPGFNAFKNAITSAFSKAILEAATPKLPKYSAFDDDDSDAEDTDDELLSPSNLKSSLCSPSHSDRQSIDVNDILILPRNEDVITDNQMGTKIDDSKRDKTVRFSKEDAMPGIDNSDTEENGIQNEITNTVRVRTDSSNTRESSEALSHPSFYSVDSEEDMNSSFQIPVMKFTSSSDHCDSTQHTSVSSITSRNTVCIDSSDDESRSSKMNSPNINLESLDMNKNELKSFDNTLNRINSMSRKPRLSLQTHFFDDHDDDDNDLFDDNSEFGQKGLVRTSGNFDSLLRHHEKGLREERTPSGTSDDLEWEPKVDGDLIRSHILRLQDEESTSELDARHDVQRMFAEIEDSLIDELGVQALISLLPESKDGLHPIAVGLFSPNPLVRIHVLNILMKIESYDSTRPAFDALNGMLKSALQRIRKSLEDGTMQQAITEYEAQLLQTQMILAQQAEEQHNEELQQNQLNHLHNSISESELNSPKSGNRRRILNPFSAAVDKALQRSVSTSEIIN